MEKFTLTPETHRQIVEHYGSDAEVVKAALGILQAKIVKRGTSYRNVRAVKSFLTLTLAPIDHEIIYAMFLDADNRLIHGGELFRGSVSDCHTDLREIARTALRHNASGVILAHNHPAKSAEPSQSDIKMTKRLARALALIDVTLFDHIVVAGDVAVSMREKGWL